MKKLFLLAIGVMFYSVASAQNETDSIANGNQEVKINLAMSVVGIPEISYEYFLEDNTSVGLSIGAALDTPEDLSLRFIGTAYYRLFFGKKPNAGFFIEGNAAVVHYRDIYDEYYYTYYEDGDYSYIRYEVDDESTNFGLGAAVGFKLMTRNNYVGEIYAGAGRLFGDSHDIEVFPRVGVSIGKRF
ncbi:hypothetical protein [Mesonia maritima]|uniref:DUF3575 domain-containing protein n=1 Tax=Mesonia maritima TaxID=1793873 RepID=A0ABU1K1H8_9FLAO|nr:hypothetical protein [Mesonia maritima]MDR6299469.1 hypothetical protein [Mesonia maritima]